MTQQGPVASPDALIFFRNAAFERARFHRESAAWYADAEKFMQAYCRDMAHHHEAMAQREEDTLHRVDLALNALNQPPGTPPPNPMSDPPAPGVVVLPPGHTLSVTGEVVPVTTEPGEAARRMPGPGYHSPAADGGLKGGIGDAVPVPQTPVGGVQYEKGEARPPEGRSGHMATLPRPAAELLAERDAARKAAEQKAEEEFGPLAEGEAARERVSLTPDKST